jgi:hypothetical protein
MLSVKGINIQPGFSRVVLLVINLYATLMMTPIFSPDNVSYGLAKPGETETDVLPWKKTRRREASTSKPAARRCSVVVRTVTLLLCIWQFIVQIRPCSVRLVYSSQWLVELGHVSVLVSLAVIPVTGKTASAACSESPHYPDPPFRITIWSSELCSYFNCGCLLLQCGSV